MKIINKMFLQKLMLLLILLNIALRYNEAVENNSLVAVAVLYRHGDRAVEGSYPGDPYHDIKYWPEGFGELLNSGKLRQYNLGKWFRDRYDNFLSKKYLKKEITVQSSNFDRCLMSAGANLAGLYSPNKSDRWLKDLAWEPVPIHTKPDDLDPYLAMSQPCPKHEKLLNLLHENNEIFRQLPKKYHREYEIVANHTGWNVTVSTFQGIYTTFYVYSMRNKSFIPDWAYSLNSKNFAFLASLSFASETFTDELKTLKAGPFYRNLLRFFNEVAKKGKESPKFLMLSGHDGTVVAALQTMGVYDFQPPEFSSTVIWELHSNEPNSYFMKLFYKKPSREDLIELKMLECGEPCTYEAFSRVLRRYVLDEAAWEKMCQIEGENDVKICAIQTNKCV